ncbi:long-chain fatty acid transport protein 2-like isoform X2 [Rhinoraja longicauda]
MLVMWSLAAALLATAVLFWTLWSQSEVPVVCRMVVSALRLWWWSRRRPPITLLDVLMQRARESPDKLLLLFEGQELTYGQLDADSNRLGRALLAATALSPGDCAALLLPNGPLFLTAWFGLSKLGCPAAFLNTNVRGNALLHCFRSSGARLLLTSAGLPKAAIINHLRAHRMASFVTGCGFCSSDILYITLPLYHSSGSLLGIGSCISAGATAVLRRKFSASQFWDDCRKHNVTVIQYIGELLRYLCNVPKKNNDRDHTVRVALGNGARADVWKEFLNRFGNIRICEFYGATEGNVGFMNYGGKIGAAGKVNFFTKMLLPFHLVKYDAEIEAPVRDANGYCIKVPTGEVGLLLGEITPKTPFIGYVGNTTLTEKKHLRDVFRKGDVYFNSGDLMMLDHDNFIYFQDRIGDTYRWKGENVSTVEVADVLSMLDFVQNVCVYGVTVPGHEGRIGMAAIQLHPEVDMDGEQLYERVVDDLPVYARPRFLRIQKAIETTGTFKYYKVTLVKEGFNPDVVQDSLFILDDKKKAYVPMDQEIYQTVISNQIKL